MGGRAPSPMALKGQKVGKIWPNTGEPLERIPAQPRSCTHTKQQQNASLRANYRVQVQRVFLSTDRVERSGDCNQPPKGTPSVCDDVSKD
jgi:hypothetical protein